VAACSGDSKGGLLHHYITKEALLNGVVQNLIDAFDQRMAAILAIEEAAGASLVEAQACSP
jgi:AcrR family transcriptional regulator